MKTLQARIEKFFFLFLMINPFLDIISGVYINVMETLSGRQFEQFALPFTPSLVVRMLVLLVFAAYILMVLDKKAILTIVPIGVAWALSVVGEILFFYSFDLFTDMQYIARFVFNIAVLFVYARVFQRSGLTREEIFRKLNFIVSFTAAVLSLSIILSYLFEVGYQTYGDIFSIRGARGFFYSGNDITAILMLLLPVAICTFLRLPREKKRWVRVWYACAPAFTMTALCLIGTKTAFLAVGVSFAAMLAYVAFRAIYAKEWRLLVGYGHITLALILTIAVIFAFEPTLFQDLATSYNITEEVMQVRGVTSALLSGRQYKLSDAWRSFKSGGVFSWFGGVGRGTQFSVIEMDIFEVFIYYGIIGFVAMLWLYAKLGLGLIQAFFKRFDMTMLACALSVGLCAGYLVIAGHILFSVSSGFYFSFMLLYATLYKADSPADMRL